MREKSLELLDMYLKNTSEEERRLIWEDVKKLNLQGPTITEYLKLLDS